MTTMTVKIQNVDELFDDMRQASKGEALGNIVSFESYQAFAAYFGLSGQLFRDDPVTCSGIVRSS